MNPEKGKTYSRKEIAEIVGVQDVQSYMPAKDGRVLCVCLTQEYHPGADQVVLVGAGPDVEGKADLLCGQGDAVPVFFKKHTNQWEYAGKYVCESASSDSEVLGQYEERSGRMNLTKVLFLKELRQSL